MTALEFEDDFTGDALDESRWLPYYLPHWSGRERSRARYAVGGGLLRLRIEHDQEPWCPELDGELRVSSLQTGLRTGQHRFNPEAVVREEQPEVRLYTPRYGRIEMRAAALVDEQTMAALWLIGFEDEPERSGEICVCELFGHEAGPDRSVVRVGIHPFGDPELVDDFSHVTLPIDVREFHVYAAEWEPGRTAFSVDGESVKTVAQAPDYPMQLMLGLYELPGGERRPDGYPKELLVDWVRGYRLAS